MLLNSQNSIYNGKLEDLKLLKLTQILKLHTLYIYVIIYHRSREGFVAAHYAAAGGHLPVLQYLYDRDKTSVTVRVSEVIQWFYTVKLSILCSQCTGP